MAGKTLINYASDAMETAGKGIVEGVTKVKSAAQLAGEKMNAGMQGALNALKITPNESSVIREGAEGVADVAKKKKHLEGTAKD